MVRGVSVGDGEHPEERHVSVISRSPGTARVRGGKDRTVCGTLVPLTGKPSMEGSGGGRTEPDTLVSSTLDKDRAQRGVSPIAYPLGYRGSDVPRISSWETTGGIVSSTG